MVTGAARPRSSAVLTRSGFGFSPRGLWAACQAGGEAGTSLEVWSFAGEPPRRRLLVPAEPLEPGVQLLALDSGEVLLCRGGTAAHRVTLVGRDGCERLVGLVETAALRLLPVPAGTGPLAVAVALERSGQTSIWRVEPGPPRLQLAARLPGLLFGGVWLDPAATVLGADRVADGGPAKAGRLDLRDGSWTPLVEVTPGSNDRLWLCSPRSGLVVLSTDAAGEDRLGWGTLDGRERVRFPETLRRLGQAARPLAADPAGERLVLRGEQGVRSRLGVYHPASGRLRPLQIPMGTVGGSAHWDGEVLRVPFSSPSSPTGVASVGTGADGGWSLAGSLPGHPVPWTGARVEHLRGAAGPVEALVYGGTAWRHSPRLVLALHGGPLAAWRFEFDPLFQRLAAAGITVVAPNQRGSDGYGNAHALAIRGAWGGPDLDDVVRIATDLARERDQQAPGLCLLGVSYGAFLALLAACREPALWSRCVAVAPFLSGPRLYREGSLAVKDLIHRMGGAERLRDDLGPRDLLRLCDRIQARLLLVHGDRDEVVPVGQSRTLRRRLLDLGRREPHDFEYLEIQGGHHDLLGPADGALRQRVAGFLAGGDQPATAAQSPVPTSTERSLN